jgi:hypothetical protein
VFGAFEKVFGYGRRAGCGERSVQVAVGEY